MSHCKILIIIMFIVVLVLLLNCFNSKDGFENTDNYVYTNSNEQAELLDYGGNNHLTPLSKTNYVGYPASDEHGTQFINKSNAGDSRLYKWTNNPAETPNIDLATNEELKIKYENMYMLAPELSKYDISKSNYSMNCCSAQFSPMYKDGQVEQNCDYANKYIANGYSGQNFGSEGCACITPEQGEFYTMRGGNTSA